MNKINADGGFLAGIFGNSKKNKPVTRTRSGSSKGPKMEPKPSESFKKIPRSIRNEFLAMSGEFVGTFMFLFFAFAGTQIANTPTSVNGVTVVTEGPNTSVLLYIALCFGFSLAVNAWIFFRVTGGLFNPAVTLGLCLIGAVPFSRGCLVVIAQLLGGMASAAVVSGLFPGPLAVTTSLSAGTSLVQGVFIEMFLTAQLVFTIFMLAAEKHKSTFLAPVGIGLSLFIAELGGVYYTGGSLNPARSFGPCVALRSFPREHWIYWIGPLLGALVAAGFFWFIKSCEYETVNPGQDFDDLEANAFDPEVDLTRPVVMPTAQLDTSSSRPVTAEEGTADHRMNQLMDGRQPSQHHGYEPEKYGLPNGYNQQDGYRQSDPYYQHDGYEQQERHGRRADRYEQPDRYRQTSRGTSKTYTIQAPHPGEHSN